MVGTTNLGCRLVSSIGRDGIPGENTETGSGGNG